MHPKATRQAVGSGVEDANAVDLMASLRASDGVKEEGGTTAQRRPKNLPSRARQRLPKRRTKGS
jgi:hypothetical protein